MDLELRLGTSVSLFAKAKKEVELLTILNVRGIAPSSHPSLLSVHSTSYDP